MCVHTCTRMCVWEAGVQSAGQGGKGGEEKWQITKREAGSGREDFRKSQPVKHGRNGDDFSFFSCS